MLGTSDDVVYELTGDWRADRSRTHLLKAEKIVAVTKEKIVKGNPALLASTSDQTFLLPFSK